MKKENSINTDKSKINGLLNEVFEEIESRSLGNSGAGKTMSFYDLDAITQAYLLGTYMLLEADQQWERHLLS